MSTMLADTVVAAGVTEGRPDCGGGPSQIRVTRRVQEVLLACGDAYAYARRLDRGLWDFAIEISTLRQMGMSRSDLRWFVGKGLLDCAIETSLPEDPQRSFRPTSRPLFCKNTCFVLTPDGAELALALTGRGEGAIPEPPRPSSPSQLESPVPETLVPKWDRDRQTLSVGRAVVKQFKVPAENQEIVLAAFEEEAWPSCIDDPLPPRREHEPKRRLRETIKSLNRNQKQNLIRFVGAGSGRAIRWELRDGSQAARVV